VKALASGRDVFALPGNLAAAVDRLRVAHLVTDSRAVQPGDTFLAFPGENRDGRDYIGQALERGAASVLWERHGYAWNAAWRVPNIGVAALRRRAGEIASRVYGRPSAKLWMLGVTGTNGKTSCSHWLAQSLSRCGTRSAVIGTLGNGFPGHLSTTSNTTPDAVTLHGLLRDYATAGARAAAMEVSSHGLSQHRLSGVEFDVALLTNLSRDHLDYHCTMRAYRAAKARLFAWPTLKWAVINLDDSFGVEMAARVRDSHVRIIGYSFNPLHSKRTARNTICLAGRNLAVTRDGLSFEVATPWGAASISSSLIGRFNAANLLGTLAALLASDVALEDAVAALQRVQALPGRTERHGGRGAPLVIIDYAHTPDALEKVLSTLRETMTRARDGTCHRTAQAPGDGRLICVFGCGGERDRGKRPLMGKVASALADHVVVTSDNPRGEDPHAIVNDITSGVRGTHYTIEPDRKLAIRLALDMARGGDVVLVAGKGHEQYQEIRGVRHPYSDTAEVRDALQSRRRARKWA
jgi:UDP-N-acetylmuramoyl-L-alanyl-D-glutamate--2,6-diaminopimelate ligase